jgi:N-acetylglucosamine-6-phosphate deacetylase
LIANGEEVIYHDGCFHRKKDDVIAGSALTMINGVKNLMSYGMPVENAVKFASMNPAQVMKYSRQGALIPGFDADVVVFDKYCNVLATIIKGSIKKNIL